MHNRGLGPPQGLDNHGVRSRYFVWLIHCTYMHGIDKSTVSKRWGTRYIVRSRDNLNAVLKTYSGWAQCHIYTLPNPVVEGPFMVYIGWKPNMVHIVPEWIPLQWTRRLYRIVYIGLVNHDEYTFLMHLNKWCKLSAFGWINETSFNTQKWGYGYQSISFIITKDVKQIHTYNFDLNFWFFFLFYRW